MNEGPESAEPLCRKMTKFWPNYKVGGQQDVHELCNRMMDEVQMKCFQTEDWADDRRIFYGREESTVIGSSCKTAKKRREVFSSLSISIEKHQTTSQAIEAYFKDEIIKEWTCDVCGKKAEAFKKTRLETIPRNIIFHLQRFNGWRKKIMKKIELHFNLYMHNFAVENVILEDKARLFGIIVHKGSTVSNGHYYAFIQFGSQWYRVNDRMIDPVAIQTLRNIDGQAYMLFYST